MDFSLAFPAEVCTELGERARARRILLTLSVEELSARVGVSDKTVRHFEKTGRCTLETFVRILEALNALADLQSVLVTETRSIESMRENVAARSRQRASAKPRTRAT